MTKDEALIQVLEALDEFAHDAAIEALASAKTMYSDSYKPQRLKAAHDDLNRVTAAIAACRAALAQPDGWQLAIDDQMVIAHIDTTDGGDPVKCLRQVIDWHVAVALDPAVSESAQALIDRGKAEAAQPDDAQDARRWRFFRTVACKKLSDVPQVLRNLEPSFPEEVDAAIDAAIAAQERANDR